MRLAAALLSVLCFPALANASEKKPHVVFVVADDLRGDVLSTYGGPVQTPNLDQLARRGVVFRRATCGYPICHVSRTEMLTGRSMVAEAASGKTIPFDAEWAIWPEVMKKAGWQTVHCGKWHVQGTPWTRGYTETAALYSGGGASGKPLTHARSATGRAVTGYTGWTFKTNDNKPILEHGIGLTPETDARITDGAIGIIENATADKPLFLHVNFTAPHDPLHWPKGLENRWRAGDIGLPKNFRRRHPFDHGNINGRDETIVPAPRTENDVRGERAVYYALVENIDAQVGRMIAALKKRKIFDSTLIIFTSDQGLALGSHGLMGKQNQYDHTANTPLIIAGPGIAAGKKLNGQCALRDLFPTVCDLTGLPIPASVQGKSLVPLLNGKTIEARNAIFGYFTNSQRMIRTADGWKLIWYPQAKRTQLFDTTTDPDELRDRSAEEGQKDRIAQLKRSLTSWLRAHGDPLGKE